VQTPFDGVSSFTDEQAFETILNELRRLEGVSLEDVENETYTETNVTESRTFDADTVTTAQLADIVGTLIVDLRAKGLID
jgi:hypothetical protein